MELLPKHIERAYAFARLHAGADEAQDLAQDILAQALISLSRGCSPKNLDAWLSGLMRKRYARWARLRRMWQMSELPEDLAFDGRDAAEELCLVQDIQSLRRELSRLHGQYRQIVIMHYLHGMPIALIATQLSLPEGTVKRRLYESRIILREGVIRNMNADTGKRSYNPDFLTFIGSGNVWVNDPWQYVKRSLPKNILSACALRPMTAQELCDELGIAMPYLEDELRILVESTLLRPAVHGKYSVDLIIIDTDLDDKLCAVIQNSITEEMADYAFEVLRKREAEVRALGFYGADMDYPKLCWLLSLWQRWEITPNRILESDSPKYEKPWHMAGVRHHEGRGRDNGFGNSLCFNGHAKIISEGIYEKININNGYFASDIENNSMRSRESIITNDIACLLCVKAANETVKADELSDIYKEQAAKLAEAGLITVTDGIIKPAFPVASTEQTRELKEIAWAAGKEFKQKYGTELAEAFDRCRSMLKASVDKSLHNQISNYISNLGLNLDSAMLDIAQRKGYLSKLPETNITECLLLDYVKK